MRSEAAITFALSPSVPRVCAECPADCLIIVCGCSRHYEKCQGNVVWKELLLLLQKGILIRLSLEIPCVCCGLFWTLQTRFPNFCADSKKLNHVKSFVFKQTATPSSLGVY